MAGPQSRNVKAIAVDISEGFITVNALFLKPYDQPALKALYDAISRVQATIRTQPFPYNKPELIRRRNVRLQRLYTAQMVIRNFARERHISIF
jgi:hypothetical protein